MKITIKPFIFKAYALGLSGVLLVGLLGWTQPAHAECYMSDAGDAICPAHPDAKAAPPIRHPSEAPRVNSVAPPVKKSPTVTAIPPKTFGNNAIPPRVAVNSPTETYLPPAVGTTGTIPPPRPTPMAITDSGCTKETYPSPISPSDPRVLTYLDADIPTNQADGRMQLQLADGQQYGSLNSAPDPGVRHADGSPWLMRDISPDECGKSVYIYRIKQGQPYFQSNTLRSEIYSWGSNLENSMIKQGGDYWVGIEWLFDGDFFNTGGSTPWGGPDEVGLTDLHGIGAWGGAACCSELHGMGFIINSAGKLMLKAHARAGVNGMVYDVTNGMSTTPIGSNPYDPSGGHGTMTNWNMTGVREGVWYRFAIRMKLSDTAAGNPELQVYRKIGDGPVEQIVDSKIPNNGAGPWRYQKAGIYKYDLSFGSKPTRTFYRRGWIVIKNQAGTPALNEHVIMDWLMR